MLAQVPRKKQTDSERLHKSMLGATLPRTRPICSSLFSPGLRTSLCKEGGSGSDHSDYVTKWSVVFIQEYTPGILEQRWRCCLLQQQARGKARPGEWQVRREHRSRSRSPWRQGLSSRPPGSHPDPPETWSPPSMGEIRHHILSETFQCYIFRYVISSVFYIFMANKPTCRRDKSHLDDTAELL